MIYEYPETSAPIRQGDIFLGLPRVDLSLQQMPVIAPGGQLIVRSWAEIATQEQPVQNE